MKIGLFNDSFPPIMDGVALAVQNTAHWLNDTNDVKVIMPYHPQRNIFDKEYQIMQFASAPVPGRPPYRMGFPAFDIPFMSSFKRMKFDIVHSHCPFSSGKLALAKARKQNIPFIATFHSKFKDDFSQVIKSKAIVNSLIKGIIDFYNRADEVWIPQLSVGETMREYGYRGKFTVVENGTDFIIETDFRSKDFAKISLGIAAYTPVFLFVGQHIFEKNLTFLIKSLAEIKDINYRAFFIGEGYARNELMELANSLGLNKKIKFTGVITDRNKLKTYFSAADLFLFPSKYDNAPLVVREAAAALTPSVLLKGSTAAEVISDNVNGYLSDDSIENFATTIKKALSSIERLSVSLNAAQTLCRSWKDIAEETEDRYKSLIRRKSDNFAFKYVS